MSLPAPSFSLAHVHPILVNFTAALVPASVGSDALGRMLRRDSLHIAAWWMLLYAAAITPFTALAGAIWKNSIGSSLPQSLILTHQWLGMSIAVALFGLAIWRGFLYSLNKPPRVAYLLAAFVIVLALAYQGSLGGAMVLG